MGVLHVCRYVKEIEKGLSVSAVLYTYTPGGSVMNLNFLWRLPDDFSLSACLSENQQVTAKLRDTLPVYHTRAMKQELVSHYGSLMSRTKPFVLRSIYRELTGDASSSRTYEEGQVDMRLKEALDSEDFDIIVDMRELNEGRTAKYDEFWEKCREFISISLATWTLGDPRAVKSHCTAVIIWSNLTVTLGNLTIALGNLTVALGNLTVALENLTVNDQNQIIQCL